MKPANDGSPKKAAKSRRPYARPRLETYGALRSLTRSASAAVHPENNPGQAHRFSNFP